MTERNNGRSSQSSLREPFIPPLGSPIEGITSISDLPSHTACENVHLTLHSMAARDPMPGLPEEGLVLPDGYTVVDPEGARRPHHSVTVTGLCGTVAGLTYTPGELAKAHGTALILDEFNEITAPALAIIAQTIVDGGHPLPEGRLFIAAKPSIILLRAWRCDCASHIRVPGTPECICTEARMRAYTNVLLRSVHLLFSAAEQGS